MATFMNKFLALLWEIPSPVLANLFLEHIESEILPNFPGIKPYFWVRYVDDILSLVPANFDLNVFMDFINSYPSLKFTFEWEDNGKIPFLDVLIHNCLSHLKFSVYRKPTNAEAYLHYFSFTATNIKIGPSSRPLSKSSTDL